MSGRTVIGSHPYKEAGLILKDKEEVDLTPAFAAKLCHQARQNKVFAKNRNVKAKRLWRKTVLPNIRKQALKGETMEYTFDLPKIEQANLLQVAKENGWSARGDDDWVLIKWSAHPHSLLKRISISLISWIKGCFTENRLQARILQVSALTLVFIFGGLVGLVSAFIGLAIQSFLNVTNFP